MNSLSWGILGTGRIAGIFAKQLSQSKTGKLAAVGSRSQTSADKFITEFHVPRGYNTYEAMLADPRSKRSTSLRRTPRTPSGASKAAKAGKHILCEKPLTLNHTEALAVVDAAQMYDIFLMEAFMYRCHPQTAKLVELLREKVIGEVRVIHTSFGFHRDFNPEVRLFKNALGGGGILDVVVTQRPMSRLVAGIAPAKTVRQPDRGERLWAFCADRRRHLGHRLR